MGILQNLFGSGGADVAATNVAIPAAHAPSQRRDSWNHSALNRIGALGGAEVSEGVEAYRDVTSFLVLNELFENGWLAGAVDAAISQIVGDGLRLNLQVNSDLLGWSKKDAERFSKEMEALWQIWAADPHECSLDGRSNLAQMQRTAMRSYFGVGEILTVFPSRKKRGGMFASKVQLLDVQRLDTSNIGGYDGEAEGVFYQGGLPAGVVVKDRNGATLDEDWQARRVPFRSRSGKPLSGLYYDHVTPQQRRGISPLAGAIRSAAQHTKLVESNLVTAQLKTVMAAYITSSANADDVLAALSNEDADGEALGNFVSNKLGFYSQQGSVVSGASGTEGFGNVTHLLPGETMDFKSAGDGSASELSQFSKILKLEIAKTLGIPYSVATGDYQEATYSSSRMEIATTWPLVMHRRTNLAGKLSSDAFRGFLQEVVIRGMVTAPGGIDQVLALPGAFKSEWQGSGMPQADEGKSAKAMETRLSTGVSSLADECSKLGTDWQQVLDQRAREKTYASDIGLPDPHVSDPEAPTPPPAQEIAAQVNVDGMPMSFANALAELDRMEAQLVQPINRHANAIQREYEIDRREETRKRITMLNKAISEAQSS